MPKRGSLTSSTEIEPMGLGGEADVYQLKLEGKVSGGHRDFLNHSPRELFTHDLKSLRKFLARNCLCRELLRIGREKQFEALLAALYNVCRKSPERLSSILKVIVWSSFHGDPGIALDGQFVRKVLDEKDAYDLYVKKETNGIYHVVSNERISIPMDRKLTPLSQVLNREDVWLGAEKKRPTRFLIKEGDHREVPLSQRGIQKLLSCNTRKALWLVSWVNSTLGLANKWKGRRSISVLSTPRGPVEVAAVRNGNQTVWAFRYKRDAAAIKALLTSLLREHRQKRPWINSTRFENPGLAAHVNISKEIIQTFPIDQEIHPRLKGRGEETTREERRKPSIKKGGGVGKIIDEGMLKDKSKGEM